MPKRVAPDKDRIRKLLATGASDQQIAERLGYSKDVVRRERKAVGDTNK